MLNHRNNGATGALLDEYEKALNELINLIKGVSHNHLIKIIDHNTNDKDCISIQAILTHIIQSGYTYVIEVRRWLGNDIVYKNKLALNSIDEYINALKEMFKFNEQLFQDYPNLLLSESDSNKKIDARWGQKYDVEQLFEHAIVHILRHRRQIEKIKLKLDAK